MPTHPFLLMEATREVDSYATYTGVPMKDLLNDAGILPGATGIMVFAPDGFSMTHPLEYDASISTNYHVYGNDPGPPLDRAINTLRPPITMIHRRM